MRQLLGDLAFEARGWAGTSGLVPVQTDYSLLYTLLMSAKLSTSNPYLSDPSLRKRSVLESVATSSAIEGIRAPFKKKSPTVKPVAKKAGSARVVKTKAL